jgi:putative peptide maturation dehydrogenase
MDASTLLRRCTALLIEPREMRELDLAGLLTGGEGIARSLVLQALAAHLDEPVVVDAQAVAVLARLSPQQFSARANLGDVSDALLEKLHAQGLLFASDDGGSLLQRDLHVAAGHWHALAAVAHRHGRWSDVRTPDVDPHSYARSLSGLVRQLGLPPEAAPQRGDAAQRVALPAATCGAVAERLRARATCRNFARDRALPLDLVASLLRGVFGAQASVSIESGAQVLKKLSPSGGGLHPTEAYVLALDVEGLAPGIWHYRALDHALDPLRLQPADELRAFALHALAGQDWFADAPLMVVHACRFGRSFWKYRGHAKAYRAVILDIGHLSQTAYLLATELGLGAFVTAAINEAQIEEALGLDPMVEGPLAVSGFGFRAAAQANPEFDPQGLVWTA